MTPARGVLLLGLALGLELAPAPASAQSATLERRFALMGTEAHVRISAPTREAALVASERAYQALREAESRLSTWTPRSELARLNATAPGRPVELSPELAAELAAALACRTRTAGAFDPEVGALVAAWGLRTGGREPAPAELESLVEQRLGPGLELEAESRRAVRHGSRTIEEGAWGKGAALDRALAAIGPEASAELDLGGQWGFSSGRPSLVVVADPRERNRPLVEIDVVGGSVSTSGNGERGLTLDGRPIGHLLDPRTGRPAPDFGSLTVWAPTALEADCLSTGLSVLGPEAAFAWVAAHPGVDLVVVDFGSGERRRVRASASLAGRIRALDPDLDLDLDLDLETARERVRP